jgi:hypothetical protein
VVASPDPPVAVGGGEESVNFDAIEVAHLEAVGPFGWDGEHPVDHLGVFGMVERGIAEQRVDRGETGVAGGDAVAPLLFEVVEEPADHVGVEVVEIEGGRRLAGALVGVAEKQPERVAIGGHGVGAGAALGDQPLGEERLQRRCEHGHGFTSKVASSRATLWASSCGVADRYQYVLAGSR